MLAGHTLLGIFAQFGAFVSKNIFFFFFIPILLLLAVFFSRNSSFLNTSLYLCKFGLYLFQ